MPSKVHINTQCVANCGLLRVDIIIIRPSALSRSIRDVFTIDRSQQVGWRMLAIAALGMGVPVAAGLLAGRPEAGFTIGLGAILLAGPPTSPQAGDGSGHRPLQAVFSALAAVLIATAIEQAPFADAAIILVSSAAALVSGYSRPLAIAAIRFIIYLVLSAGFLAGASGGHGNAALVFGCGALWNIVLRAILTRGGRVSDAFSSNAKPEPTLAQRRRYFRSTLHQLSGWQFPLRLALGLAMASGLRHLWSDHHFYWIMLTVALLTQRPIEHVPVKTIQRLVGTTAGVMLTGAIMLSLASPVGRGIVACVLAAMVPAARAKSYLLYSVVATPLILLVLDIGRSAAPALLTDRLIATFAGGAIVITLNLVFDRLLGSEAVTHRVVKQLG